LGNVIGGTLRGCGGRLEGSESAFLLNVEGDVVQGCTILGLLTGREGATGGRCLKE